MSRSLPVKVRFVIELARCLHQYGASTHRLEGAITSVSESLSLKCDLFSGPTSCLISIVDEDDLGEEHLVTKVLRLDPGDIDLTKLSLADEIADEVMIGNLSAADGCQRLAGLDQEETTTYSWLIALAYGLAGAGIGILLKGSWQDIGTTFLVGLFVGLLAVFPSSLVRGGNLEAVSAMTAALSAGLASSLIPGISREVVIVGGLIVLMPGLSLTTAMAELATNHLVSGSARLAGASMTLLKLTFGVVLGTYLAGLVGLPAKTGEVATIPGWMSWVALPVAGWAFAYLFRTRKRDMPAAIFAAIVGYLITDRATASLGPHFGISMAGLVVASMGNLYARVLRRPASVVRLPGLILLVPGSMGFRGVTMMFEKDLMTGLDTGFALIVTLASLVAGLLFGNVLVPPRRSL